MKNNREKKREQKINTPDVDYGDDYYDNDDAEPECTYCGGDGYGIEGEDWDMDDPINGPWDADEDGISPCPNCRGSGLAKDMRFW